MSISYNFDYLPDTVLSLSGYDFNQFIKNPFDIFNYDIEDEELDKLKEKLSFKLKNKKVLIKPGVISGFRSLRDALKKKVNQQLAKSKKRQRRQQQPSNVNPLSIPLSVITTLASSLLTTRPAAITKKLSSGEHRAHVLKLINKWCSENKDNFDLETFSLEENVDFMLNIDLDENSDVKGSIKCKCNKLISLGKNDDKLQVSNYYKHLQSAGCVRMKDIKKTARSSNSEQQQLFASALLMPSSQSHSPLEQIPNVLSTTTEAESRDESMALSNQSARGSKRRLMSQAQQHNLAAARQLSPRQLSRDS